MECPWFRESPVHCCIIADSPPDREVYPNPALVFEWRSHYWQLVTVSRILLDAVSAMRKNGPTCIQYPDGRGYAAGAVRRSRLGLRPKTSAVVQRAAACSGDASAGLVAGEPGRAPIGLQLCTRRRDL